MDALLDPKAYEAMRKKKCENDVRALRSKYDQMKSEVRKPAEAKLAGINQQISSKNKIKSGDWAGYGLIAGIILGFGGCSAGLSGDGWLGCVALCTLIGALAAIPAKNTKELENQQAMISRKMWQALNDLDDDCNASVNFVEEGCQKDIAEHLSQFEEAQREASVTFIGSPIAKEITDFMLKPLLRTIRSCDRRPHIKEIDVPFSFEVYSNKVTSTYGTYDFEIERVQFLKSMEEQAALANAIATAVHTEIITSFEVDPSGGEVDPMDIDYRYGTNYIKASMTYHAANGNYVEARSF